MDVKRYRQKVKKNVQLSIWFDNALSKRITKAAKESEPKLDRTEWIRQACREKLDRDNQNAAALAAHAKMSEATK